MESREKALFGAGCFWCIEAVIVTEIVPLSNFFEAEKEHQDYYRTNKKAPYCQIVIEPKLKHVEETFGNKLKKF